MIYINYITLIFCVLLCGCGAVGGGYIKTTNVLEPVVIQIEKNNIRKIEVFYVDGIIEEYGVTPKRFDEFLAEHLPCIRKTSITVTDENRDKIVSILKDSRMHRNPPINIRMQVQFITADGHVQQAAYFGAYGEISITENGFGRNKAFFDMCRKEAIKHGEYIWDK